MTYEPLKQLIIDTLHLPKDALHIYIGFGCLLISVLLFRIPLSSYRAAWLGIIVSVVIELLDLHNTVGYPPGIRWGGAVWDLVNTSLIPVATIWLVRRSRPPSKRSS